MTAAEPHTRDEEIKGSSDSAFGFVFAVVFATIGLWPKLAGVGKPRGWAMGVAFLFLISALLYPAVLTPLNRAWTRFGLLLHKVVTPVVMGVLFFGVVTPIALLMRATGSRPLRLAFEPERASYWIPREPPGPAPDTMKMQF